MKTWKTILVVVLLAGCGSSMTPEERSEWRQRVTEIQLLEAEELGGREYEVVGEVTGKSCVQSASGTLILDEQGTVHAAKADSRFAAEKLGADAVTSFICVTEHLQGRGMDRCTQGYRCTGEAIRFTR